MKKIPKNKLTSEILHSCFSYDPHTEQSQCKVCENDNIVKYIKGKHSGNLRKHLNLHHYEAITTTSYPSKDDCLNNSDALNTAPVVRKIAGRSMSKVEPDRVLPNISPREPVVFCPESDKELRRKVRAKQSYYTGRARSIDAQIWTERVRKLQLDNDLTTLVLDKCRPPAESNSTVTESQQKTDFEVMLGIWAKRARKLKESSRRDFEVDMLSLLRKYERLEEHEMIDGVTADAPSAVVMNK